VSITSWFGADTVLHDGRNPNSRPIENNTRVNRRGEDIAVTLHDTDVVTYHTDGSVTLDSGGWLTVTTKDRMNRYLGDRGRVYSDRGKWFIYQCGDKVARFFDGITIAADGTILNPPDPALEVRKAEAEKKMRKRIDTFVDGYMKLLADGMPVPSGGDCWGCSMFERGGIADNGHLLDHLTENYYVPTLLWNAMKERGYPDVNTTMAIFLDYKAYEQGTMRVRREYNSDQPDKSQLSEFRRILGKYLRKRLIPTVAA
jgi:hypothetical protein